MVLTVRPSRLFGGGGGGQQRDGQEEDEDDLVPPLEHCIRTKWRDAGVDWNGSERIL